MKVPKTVKRYCKFCKKHTEQKVSQSKKKTPFTTHPLSQWGKPRSGYGLGTGNKGKYGSKPAVSKFKRSGAKNTKKTDFRYTCNECKKTSMQKSGIRSKKVEII
jgi:large subunit ribosomal protein L44e